MELKDIIQHLTASCEVLFARSSGPGGQNVNKVNTKAIVLWPIDAADWLDQLDLGARARVKRALVNRLNSANQVVIASQKFRTQSRNLADAYEKLALLIAKYAIKPKSRKKTKPGAGAVKRRLREKKEHSQKKDNRRKPFSD